MTRFLRCFPKGDDLMLCEHHNGKWIAFPIEKPCKKKKIALPIRDRAIS
jgi:hypothetical protein